jgi:hypothetical protein
LASFLRGHVGGTAGRKPRCGPSSWFGGHQAGEGDRWPEPPAQEPAAGSPQAGELPIERAAWAAVAAQR